MSKKITESNLANLKVNSNLVIYLLEGFTWNKDLTESDLDTLKEVLSDLKETIEDVEFSLFVSPNDKEFIKANEELNKL